MIILLVLCMPVALAIEANVSSQATVCSQNPDYRSLWLSICVLFMGLILALVEMFVMIKKGKGWGPNSVRVIAVTLIFTAGLVAVTSNVGSSQNIAPLWGLLGAIAGYVLGEFGKGEEE